MGFFKAYDMRGTFGKDFDAGTVYRAGRALPEVVGRGKWLVGRDCRATSPMLAESLVRGLSESGADVVYIGECTTPMVYFFTAEWNCAGSVMVTASHNPPSDNGLKVSRAAAAPVGYADGLDRVEKAVSDGSWENCGKALPPGRVERPGNAAVLAQYVRWMKENAGTAPANLKICVDCSNGMASLLVRELFPDAIVLNDVRDGSFPAHSPNPLDPAARTQLSRSVRENGCDLGLIFDGDADRAMFLDENGAFVQCDMLVPFVAAETIEANGRPAAPKVVHDVRTSRGAIEALRETGCEPVMVPVGHAFAKPVLRKTGALCGGELAGHYYFREFHCCDSAALAALRILSAASKAKERGLAFSAMVRPVSGRYANSGEMNFTVRDKAEAMAAVDALVRSPRFPALESECRMDGVRYEFADGWVNVRASNTEPYLRVIAENASGARLAGWKELLSEAIARTA